MVITSAGLVGMGSGNTNPAYSLDVLGINTVIRSKASSGWAGLYADGATGSPSYVFFGANGVETARLRSDSSNILAIGLTSGGVAGTDRVTITNSIVALSSLLPLRLQTGSNTMDVTPTAGATDSFIWNTSSNANYIWNMASVERMRISSTGLVGIGGDPATTLDLLRTVPGSISELRIFNNSTTNGTAASLQLATGTANSFALIRVAEQSPNRFWIFTTGAGVNGGTFFDTSGMVWRSNTGATRYMDLNTAGNLLIGTTVNLARLTAITTAAPKVAHFSGAITASPANLDAQEALVVAANTATSGLTFTGSDARLMSLTVTPANEVAWRANKVALSASDTMSFYTNGTAERVRLTNGGDLRFEGSHPGPTSTTSIGYMGAPVVNITANYTIQLSDAGKTIHKNTTAAVTLTIPAESTTNFPIGTCIILDHTGSAGTPSTAMTITATSPATLYRGGGVFGVGNRSLVVGGSAMIRKFGVNNWVYTGAGA
jgi:uncharacterized membrane protein YdcZ (DUF606 family)